MHLQLQFLKYGSTLAFTFMWKLGKETRNVNFFVSVSF